MSTNGTLSSAVSLRFAVGCSNVGVSAHGIFGDFPVLFLSEENLL